MSNSYRENAVRRGANMRDKAMAMAMKRKEEYLGARVPKALKARVMSKADEMGIPVSLLMRRLLEQSFPEDREAAGSHVEFSEKTVTAEQKPLNQPGSELKTAKYADIIAWKNIEVNQDRSCERCKEPLPRGCQASLGFTATEVGYVIVCSQCKTQLCES